MHNILSPKWMRLVSRDRLKFWEISDNTSLQVQDRDSCNRRLIGNRMWPIEWHQCQCPWMTLKVTFADLNLSNFSTPWNKARMY